MNKELFRCGGCVA